MGRRPRKSPLKATGKKTRAKRLFGNRTAAKVDEQAAPENAAAQPRGGMSEIFKTPSAGMKIDVKVPTTRFDPEIAPGAARDFLAKTPPISLFPLSLEYRFVTRDKPVAIRDASPLRSALARVDLRSGRLSETVRRAAADRREKIIADFAGKTATIQTLKLASVEELWVRWYPEDTFAEKGVAPLTPEETAAKAAFEEAIGGRAWWDLGDAEVSAGWQNFARTVGPFRAIHLMRGGAGDPDHPERIGRIAALPGKVELYASRDNGLTKLGEGRPIPPNRSGATSRVAYTPDAADQGGWLVDFDTAVDLGMGLKLTDEAMIKAAKEADWIIAVGLSGASAAQDVEALISSHIATGAFAVLPQDAPTNNTPDAPSHLARPESDLGAFTPRATAAERRSHGANSAADLLAEAFDLPPDLLRKAIDSDDAGFEDARAMLRVIGPALLDESLDGVSRVDGVSENQFIDVLAAAISARGVLPALRFGDSAMGVLPMTPVTKLEPPETGGDTPTGKVHDFLRNYAVVGRAFLAPAAARRVPVIRPGDPEAPDKLFDILGATRVSKRVDVVATEGGDPKALGCAYVEGRTKQTKAGRYLNALRTERIDALPDPDSRNREWPLLYRLARISLTRNTTETALKIWAKKVGLPANDPKMVEDREGGAILSAIGRRSVAALGSATAAQTALSGLTKGEIGRISQINAAFAQALSQLERIAARPDGIAQLEVLICEVIDLFQHRIDAVATGLAYARLKADRAAGQKGLRAGYYGFLGKLRPDSVTGGGDGYIQAPSAPQAVTAALLRSAYLRHRGDGAFKIDLSSRRVRGALKLLDLIGKGHSLNECLGLRGERWLHDRRHDTTIIALRARYPLASERGEPVASRRVFDAMAFLGDAHGREPLRGLKRRLDDDLDALADVVMAEATHQRALGRGGAASAWLRVLSGHPPPGQPVFLKTQRHGQASSHRVSLLLETAPPSAAANPREIAEPGLAALARRMTPDFDQAALTARIAGGGPPMTLTLGGDLGLAPLDLVIGGISEIELRAQYAVRRRIIAADGAPGALSVELSADSAALTDTLNAADALRRAISGARALEASDLNAAAPASAGDMDEADGIAAIQRGIADLRTRMMSLAARMQAALGAVATPLAAFDNAMSEGGRRRDAGEAQTRIDESLGAAAAHGLNLAGALADLAAFGAPDALRPLDVAKIAADPLQGLGALRDLVARVENRLVALRAALTEHQATGHASLAAARAARRGCVKALQDALDGEALPILPAVPRDQARLRPAVAGPQSVAAALGTWAEERPGLRALPMLASAAPEISAFRVTDDATTNPADPVPDARDAAEAPPVRHHGVFIAAPALVAGAQPVAGLVIDEWSVTRPSQTQMAGIAINYDSPQSEPPHCVILGVAPNETYKSWTSQRAAELVQETIAWMTIRALSSHDRITPGALFPGANVVSRLNVDGESRTRIPTRSIFDTLADANSAGLSFEVTGVQVATEGLKARDLTERTGYRWVKE